MRVVDLNVLLYAVNSDATQHAAVRAWWEAAVNGEETVGLAWIVLLGFLRLTTNPRMFPRPLTFDAAAGKVETWLSCDKDARRAYPGGVPRRLDSPSRAAR